MIELFRIPRVLFGIGLLLACERASRAADDQAFARTLLDKSIKTVGGAEASAKLKLVTWKGKGKATADGAEVGTTTDWSVKEIDKYHIDIGATINGNVINGTIILNAAKGWVKTENSKTSDLPKEAIAELRDAFYALRIVQHLSDLRDKTYELSPLGELKIEGKDTVGLCIKRKGRRDVNLYVDKTTSLPLKVEARVTGAGQEILIEYFLSNYKEFDGLKHFTKLIVKRDGKMFLETELSDLKAQESLDDSLFDKP